MRAATAGSAAKSSTPRSRSARKMVQRRARAASSSTAPRDPRRRDRRLRLLGDPVLAAALPIPAGTVRPCPDAARHGRPRSHHGAGHRLRLPHHLRLPGTRASGCGRVVARGARAPLHAEATQRASPPGRGAEPAPGGAQPRARAPRAALSDRQGVLRRLAPDAAAARRHRPLYADLIRSAETGNDPAPEVVQAKANAVAIEEALGELNRVLRDLLVFSRDLRLNLYPHPLVAVVVEAVEECHAAAAARGVTLWFDCPTEA